eukprot:4307160-Pyramimonas_sp.AAC.1
MARKLKNLGEWNGAVRALKGSIGSHPPTCRSVSEAKMAAATVDHCAAAPGLEGPPAEKGHVLFGPEE